MKRISQLKSFLPLIVLFITANISPIFFVAMISATSASNTIYNNFCTYMKDVRYMLLNLLIFYEILIPCFGTRLRSKSSRLSSAVLNSKYMYFNLSLLFSFLMPAIGLLLPFSAKILLVAPGIMLSIICPLYTFFTSPPPMPLPLNCNFYISLT